MSQYLARLKNLENGGEGTLKNLKNPPQPSFLGFLGTPTPRFSKNEFAPENTQAGQAMPANDAPDRHHTWLVTLPTGERFSSMFCPPLSLAEVQARYPRALVEREPDPQPAPPLSPDALEVAYAYLRHIGETDLDAGQQFIEAVARDPEQLRGLYADVVKMGLADWPDDQADQATDIEDATAPKAVCARCGHWRADSVNPSGGLGRCLTGAPASRRVGSCWPWLDAEIRCKEFREVAR